MSIHQTNGDQNGNASGPDSEPDSEEEVENPVNSLLTSLKPRLEARSNGQLSERAALFYDRPEFEAIGAEMQLRTGCLKSRNESK